MNIVSILVRINNELPEKLVISGVTVPSPRENHLLPLVKEKKVCPQCDLGLDIKHTDVLILSQYLRSDGCMLPRRVTGLCAKQQKRIGTMVTMAQKAGEYILTLIYYLNLKLYLNIFILNNKIGLMPNIAPAWSKKDPKRRYQWKKFNKYFFESTIRA